MVWQPCEDFSPEEHTRYSEKFRRAAIRLLLTVPRGMELGGILSDSRFMFTKQEQEKLYSERNLRMTRDILIRTLTGLEEKGAIYSQGTRYIWGRKPSAQTQREKNINNHARTTR